MQQDFHIHQPLSNYGKRDLKYKGAKLYEPRDNTFNINVKINRRIFNIFIICTRELINYKRMTLYINKLYTL